MRKVDYILDTELWLVKNDIMDVYDISDVSYYESLDIIEYITDVVSTLDDDDALLTEFYEGLANAGVHGTGKLKSARRNQFDLRKAKMMDAVDLILKHANSIGKRRFRKKTVKEAIDYLEQMDETWNLRELSDAILDYECYSEKLKEA